jgi:hypothetical protein
MEPHDGDGQVVFERGENWSSTRVESMAFTIPEINLGALWLTGMTFLVIIFCYPYNSVRYKVSNLRRKRLEPSHTVNKRVKILNGYEHRNKHKKPALKANAPTGQGWFFSGWGGVGVMACLLLFGILACLLSHT